MAGYIIFTDLDGTLLDHHTYSMEAARPALIRIEETRTPLVLVSSKTRPEIETIRKDLGNRHPFITENGGAIFIPRDCGLPVPAEARQLHGYQALVLGRPSEEIAPVFDRLAEKMPVKALSRLTDLEVSNLTGLTIEQSRAARQREFGEAFILEDQSVPEEALRKEIQALGLRLTKGGRFYHLLGENDKGRAAAILGGLYRSGRPDLKTAALGDAPNDRPMLAAVDHPFLVARPDGTHADIQVPNLICISQAGPAGFNQAVLGLLRVGR